MKTLALSVLLSACAFAQALQPNLPVTKDGVTVTIRCLYSCSMPPAFIDITYADATKKPPVVFVTYYTKNASGIFEAHQQANFPSNIAFWDAPVNVTNVFVQPMGEAVFFGATQ